MHYRLLALTVLAGLGAASCSEDSPAPATTSADAPLVATQSAAAVNPSSPAAGGPATPRPLAAIQAPPTDAKYTLFCFEYGGLGHVEQTLALKEMLSKRTHRTDWHIIHGLDTSRLYLGYYRAVSTKDTANAADVARANADKEMIASLPDDQGIKYFERCQFEQLSTPDPGAAPEWNLVNLDRNLKPRDPKRRFWTLQILAFKDNPLRKEAAVQAVDGLRQNGVEAYYYHGDNVSSVCVGAWPRLAVKEQADDGTHKVGGPNTTLLVTSQPIPDQLKVKRFDDQGKPIIAVSPKFEVVDKTMEAMIQKYPEHWINYDPHISRTQDGREIVDPSFLVVIPRAKGNGYYDADEPIEPIAGNRGDGSVGFSPDDGEHRPVRRNVAGEAPGSGGAVMPDRDRPGRPGGL